ncbi:MAG: hypothetical protein EPO08_21155 [Rhodospirillaceae bacterium]|nr:MAG: hypothetical protein EPO08_21155 [Rhodospirillaceae bacterium]
MHENEKKEREAVDRVAREWIGTPFHDNACVKGHGADCAQLLRGVFVEAGVLEPFDIPYYSPQFFLHQSDERFLGWVTKFAREIELADVRTGDVVLYRIGKCFAHGAIVVAPGWPNIIHAHHAARLVRPGFGTAVHLGAPVEGVKFFSRWR